MDCGGSCDPCPAGLVDFATQVQPIFDGAGCANATSCHGQTPANAPRGFNFSLENMLKDASAPDAPQDGPLVVPCDADNSLLYKVLNGETAAPDPVIIRMPSGGPYLEAGDIQLIKDWIDQGASPFIDPGLCP